MVRRKKRSMVHGRFVKITLSTILIGVGLITTSCLGIYSIQQANRQSYMTQLQTAIGEYRLSMRRQMQSDSSALQILAEFIKNQDAPDFSSFVQGVQTAQGNDPFLRIGYYTADGLQSRVTATGRIEQNIPFDQLQPELQQLIRQALAGQQGVSPVFFDDTLQRQILVYGMPVYNTEGSVSGVVCGTKGLSAFERILEEESIARMDLDITWLDGTGRVIAASTENVFRPVDGSALESAQLSEAGRASLEKALQGETSCTVTLTENGEEYTGYMQPMHVNGWYLLCVDPVNSGRSPVYSVLISANILIGLVIVLCIGLMVYVRREMRSSDRELVRLAYYDKLTGAYNFEKFQQELAFLLEKDWQYSVAGINLRQFQYINEIMGKEQANRVLQKTADVLRESLGPEEIFCRANADQFYLALHQTDRTAVRQRMQRILDQINGISRQLNISYPIILYSGVAVAQEEGEDPVQMGQELLHRAEFTQKHTETNYKSVLAFYDRSMHLAENLQNAIESSMQDALNSQEFKLFLQPKMDLRSGKVAGAEALVRWIQQDQTLVYPDQFIPAFEKNGFCAQLDLYMVEYTCRQLRQWIDEGYEPICISVNQSKRLFYQSDYVERLCNVLGRYQIESRFVQLEILEGLAIENIEEMNRTLQRLRKKGFRLSLDDFGSGYSSLNVLSSIAVDEVKFDKAFLLESYPEKKQKNMLALKNVARLAKDLHIQTVVEGIELKEDEDFIRQIGCDYGQGYYYSAPIEPEEFSQRFLRKQGEE